MKLDKISKTLSTLMISLFALLILFAAFMGISNLEYKSYIAAFAAAIVLFGLYFALRKKLPDIKLKRPLICLTALCFLVNGLWILIFRIEPDADFKTYWLYAQALVENQVAVNHYVALFPHIFGYAWVLSGFIKLFGAGKLLAPVINLLLTCGSGIIIYLLCSKEYGRKAAAFAYLLWIFFPSKLIYNSMVLSEPLYTFLILLVIYIIYTIDLKACAEEKPVLKGVVFGAASGLILRLINCVRPIAAVIIIAFVIWLLLLHGGKDTGKRFRLFVPFFAALLAVYIPLGSLWSSYMEKRMGEEPTSVTGYSIYVGFNPQTGGSYSDDDMNELFSCYFGQELSATDSHKALLEKAKERMKSGEISYPSFIAGKIGKLMGNDEGGAFYAEAGLSGSEYSLLCIFSNIYYYLVIMLSAFGAYITIRNKKYTAMQLCQLYVLGLTCAHMLVEVAGRYHYSIIPMLVITAAAAEKKQNLNI